MSNSSSFGGSKRDQRSNGHIQKPAFLQFTKYWDTAAFRGSAVRRTSPLDGVVREPANWDSTLGIT
jgi:hypothetical protein